jgi:hypothetical protein
MWADRCVLGKVERVRSHFGYSRTTPLDVIMKTFDMIPNVSSFSNPLERSTFVTVAHLDLTFHNMIRRQRKHSELIVVYIYQSGSAGLALLVQGPRCMAALQDCFAFLSLVPSNCNIHHDRDKRAKQIICLNIDVCCRGANQMLSIRSQSNNKFEA